MGTMVSYHAFRNISYECMHVSMYLYVYLCICIYIFSSFATVLFALAFLNFLQPCAIDIVALKAY